MCLLLNLPGLLNIVYDNKSHDVRTLFVAHIPLFQENV